MNGENSNEKIALIITLLMACHLTACSSAVQETSIALEQSEQPLPASTEVLQLMIWFSSFRETTYLEILTTYARALSENGTEVL